jgi:hypothetical protein
MWLITPATRLIAVGFGDEGSKIQVPDRLHGERPSTFPA